MIRKIATDSTVMIALIDSSKFGKTGFSKLGNTDIFNMVVTNKEIEQGYKTFFYEHNIKLFETFNIVD